MEDWKDGIICCRVEDQGFREGNEGMDPYSSKNVGLVSIFVFVPASPP